MYPTTAEVMKVEIESDRDMDAVDVTITLKRHPAEVRYRGLPPDVTDLPWDFRNAIESWLGIDLTPSRPDVESVGCMKCGFAHPVNTACAREMTHD